MSAMPLRGVCIWHRSQCRYIAIIIIVYLFSLHYHRSYMCTTQHHSFCSYKFKINLIINLIRY